MARRLDRIGGRSELKTFIEAENLDVVDEDEQPRMILVAAGFQAGVISTVPLASARLLDGHQLRARWSAYVDVALAGDSPKGAMGVGSWLSNNKCQDVPNVYPVLNAIGEVSPGWKGAGPGLPPDPDGVRALLEEEGIMFDDEGRADQSQRWTIDNYRQALQQGLTTTARVAEWR